VTEGRKHQVKRVLAAVGLPVRRCTAQLARAAWRSAASASSSATATLTSSRCAGVHPSEAATRRRSALEVTGLDEIELVWDGAPIVLAYPPTTEAGTKSTYRYSLELEFLAARASSLGYVDADPIFEKAMADGLLPAA
jgi:hypothetical protein